MNKRDLKRYDQKYVWHPFTQMQDWEKEDPLIIESGQGVYLYDIDGKKYLDGISSLWVNVLGHNNLTLNKAIEKQLKKVAHSTLLGLANVPSIELAKKLVEITPKKLTKVFYSDSGSTAMEIALKIAYQYWQQVQGGKFKTKKKFLTFVNAYHGDTIGSVSLGGINLFHKIYKSLLFKTFKVNKLDLKVVEKVLRKNHTKIAAIVIEPLMQGAAGMIKAPPGFLKGLETLAKKYNVLLICDEVATGFGRTGRMFACEHENVQPDIMALAKGLSGGYLPLAATLASQKIYNAFKAPHKEQKTFFHGHTYTGNPLACAVALETIKYMQNKKIIRKIQPTIKYLAKRLSELKNLKNVGDIRQMGFMVGIELVQDRKTKKPYAWEKQIGVKVCQNIRKYGVILRPLGNVIVLMPPLIVNKKQIDYLVDSLKRSIGDGG